jgi:hypothetical protein
MWRWSAGMAAGASLIMGCGAEGKDPHAGSCEQGGLWYADASVMPAEDDRDCVCHAGVKQCSAREFIQPVLTPCDLDGVSYPSNSLVVVPDGRTCRCTYGDIICPNPREREASCEVSSAGNTSLESPTVTLQASGATFVLDCAVCQCSDGAVICENADCSTFAACRNSSECAAGSYCRQPFDCGGRGYCVPLPTACNAPEELTCACNGVTYPSPCAAATEGLSIRSTGACTSLVCHFDGVVYQEGEQNSDCTLPLLCHNGFMEDAGAKCYF